MQRQVWILWEEFQKCIYGCVNIRVTRPSYIFKLNYLTNAYYSTSTYDSTKKLEKKKYQFKFVV